MILLAPFYRNLERLSGAARAFRDWLLVEVNDLNA